MKFSRTLILSILGQLDQTVFCWVKFMIYVFEDDVLHRLFVKISSGTFFFFFFF